MSARLLIPFVAALAVTTTAIVQRLQHHPYGDWDAWSMWNARAKYLAGGETWRYSVAPELIGKHSDYPLLLPAVVAAISRFTGDVNLAGRAVALGSFLAVVALAVGAMAWRRETAAALIGGSILLASKLYAGEATSQYADVPLSLLFLAAIVCLSGAANPRLAAAAGFFASLAAGTKDEGLLFIAFGGLGAAIAGGRRGVAAYCAGAAPLAMLIVYFKLMIAPAVATPLGTQSLADLLGKAADLSRYASIWSRMSAPLWQMAPPVALLVLLVLLRGVSITRSAAAIWIVLALQWASYCIVFLLTQVDLDWLLNAAVDRLVCQLWPSAVFAAVACLRPGAARGA
jgi:hypothetical protein